ncbi:GDSL esterase/lipase At4g01130 isoform X3 [Ziziphus jujuba]|uniref:GDSL esterase/lipase At4g01130 isoform X3 n=1 Tax=Ziziphus jujuba TaxID=326968 RepID=A0ABM3IUU3_ZIZJJ|nr:GDSL esterase/lipase At4g01130 isoform X3 [Ziziphus jujuba]
MGVSLLQKFLLIWMVVVVESFNSPRNSKCEFKAIFNFGDSNSDTGGFWAAFPAQSGPFGMTYFKKPVGRASDGRLIVDFLESNRLPSPDIFGKSIYSFYIGQNDFTSNLAAIGIGGVQQYLPRVVYQIAGTIKELYAIGGRTFLVLNLAPVGCYPALLVELPHNSSDIDQFGCLISYNNAVVDYNNLLKQTLAQTRISLPNASLIYVDAHSVLLELFRHPTSHGLKYGTKACCGYGEGAYNFDPRVYCGNTKVINGSTVTATACSDPYNYVSWDGIHATEAANKIVAKAILSGSYFDPPFPIDKLCDIHSID